jgi:hypothetical protein
MIVSRQPRNRIGWLILLLAVMIVLDNSLNFYLNSFNALPTNPSPAIYVAFWYTGFGWILNIVVTMFIVLLFPTGRLPGRRWRWVAALGLGVIVYAVINSSIGEGWGLYGTDWFLPNPLALIPQSTNYAVPLYVIALLLLAAFFVFFCALSLFIRYLRAGIVERKQIKWFLFACGLFVLILPLNFALSALGLEDIGSGLANLLYTLAVLALPLAIGIAILRYNLFDIDLIIRKTIIYAILTAVLAAIYFGVVVLLQSILESVSGQQSPISIVISTLVIAALFAPLRRRVQDFIDRRFYRRKYDAEKTLASFGQFVRDETDLEALTAELLRVTEETMQPEQVSIWLKQPAKEIRDFIS